MFPTEEEKARETQAERKQRRAAAGTDRRALNQVAKAVLLLFCGLALLVAADVAGVERRRTKATVVGFADRSAKHIRGCTTELLTGYGIATIVTNTTCRDAPWHLGDTAEVEARQLRFTRTIVVSTHGTIFKSAQGGLPEW